jgi:general secretion pathway protein F
MEAATLDDFLALNDQLAAMVEAGVPVDIGLDETPRKAPAALERINAAVARRASRGATLSEAVSGDPAIPARYSCLMQLGLRSGSFGAALDESHQLAAAAEQSSYAVCSALFYPIVVIALACLGMVGFCLYFVPTLEGIHADLDIPEGLGLRALRAARAALPLWLAIPPILMLVLAAWLLQRRRGSSTTTGRLSGLGMMLPGARGALALQRWANFADALSKLLDAGAPLDEALRIASCAVGDSAVQSSAQRLAVSLERDKATALPPFLRWALLDAEPGISRAQGLKMAADVYRDAAVNRAERVRVLAPVVACAVIGGGVTLLYALVVFAPVVDLLQALAAPAIR